MQFKEIKSILLDEEELDEDPVEAIEGLLEDLDVDSIKLQHNLSKFWLQ